MQGVRNSIGCLEKHALKQVGETKHFSAVPLRYKKKDVV